MTKLGSIEVHGACEHNLKDIDVVFERGKITVVTGVSGSGKSSLAFDTVLAEAQRRFFYTLSHYSRQFLDLGTRPAVRRVTGLSPAIALAQNETQPSRRATVGTLTDSSELLGVLFARFGTQTCPTHGTPTAATTTAAIVDRIMDEFDGETLAISVPLAESKKGIFKAQLTAFANKGYLRAWIDGAVVPLSPLPVLEREEKHTIKMIVDHVKIKAGGRERLLRSIETALAENKDGPVCEFHVASKLGELDLTRGGTCSLNGGCPICGFSWPKLDSRYFSANSLGRCTACFGLGVDVPGSQLGSSKELAVGDETDQEGESSEDASSLDFLDICESCRGTGVDAQSAAIKLADKSVHDLLTMPLTELENWTAQQLVGTMKDNPAFVRVASEVRGMIKRMVDVGLGYVTLSRRVRSLSGGEAQRLKLAGILTDSLHGVLYVLDEPSQGLHPAELDRLWQSLEKLKAQGSTVLIVDHDESLMRRADAIVDLGPGGGASGGRLMARFAPNQAASFARDSLTARHLSQPRRWHADPSEAAGDTSWITLKGASLHNLRIPQVRFRRGAINVVTGVSGAGKTSLAVGTLWSNLKNLTSGSRGTSGRSKKNPALRHCTSLEGWEGITTIDLIDRRPVAKSSVSMPASYLDILGELRDLYAQIPEAQIAGLDARAFSLHTEGGRCPECKGKGETSLSMRFLADARVRCSVCEGKRYKQAVLDVRYDGRNLAEVLDLTLEEAAQHFASHRKIAQRLQPALDLGLGYLKLGQPTASLSGGEAQRLKIVPYLQKKVGANALFVLDEPTTGLHFGDVERLLKVLRNLAAAGATIITIEHNTDVILAADWMVDLGPGAASGGGTLVWEGTPVEAHTCKTSQTAQFLPRS